MKNMMVRTYMAASGYKERGKLLSVLSCHDTCWILMLIIKEEWGRDRFGGSMHGRWDAFLLGGQQGELGTMETWRAFAHRCLGYVARFFNILKRSQTSMWNFLIFKYFRLIKILKKCGTNKTHMFKNLQAHSLLPLIWKNCLCFFFRFIFN